MSLIRLVHLVNGVLWPAAALLGIWRGRRIRRRRARRRIYLVMAIGLAVGAEQLAMAVATHHPHVAAHAITEVLLAVVGAAALFLLAAYGDEMAHEDALLFALSRGRLGDDGPRALRRPLSPREVEVIGLLCRGLGTEEIAARLHLSPHTVSTHIRNLMGKIGVGSRVDAVSWAIRTHLYDPVSGAIDPRRAAAFLLPAS